MDRRLLIIAIAIIALFGGLLLSGSFAQKNVKVVEDGQYCTVDEVAAYIKEFHKLPSNYITKSEAKALGWNGGPLKNYAPGKSIGGDVFTNREKSLPKTSAKYIECDINANGTSRGPERIIYNSETFQVYYTSDHYKTFKEV
ncbi:ribonuclease domain-containing protein [Methanobrevibacter sp.]|uniref:ribonuclease domain-containing protein n=1 Tax=Methanobrevibacter sp. TaxID=66852 RepID=UPI00388D4D20